MALDSWADSQPTVVAVQVSGSRASGNARADSDLDPALELELTTLTGIEVRDIQLRTDPVVSGPIITICCKM